MAPISALWCYGRSIVSACVHCDSLTCAPFDAARQPAGGDLLRGWRPGNLSRPAGGAGSEELKEWLQWVDVLRGSSVAYRWCG